MSSSVEEAREMSARIGIGALATSTRAGVRQSGIHRYTVQLLSALPSALEDETLVIYGGGVIIPAGGERVMVRNPAISLENPALRAAWENVVLPVRAWRDRLDLYHGLAFTTPKALRVPSIVTIHDLAFLRWPDQVPARRSKYLRQAVRDSVRQSERVIAVSEHTKRDVMELLEVPGDRIDVTPLGVDFTMHRAGEAAVEAFRATQALVNPFILAAGNLEPRKNLAALIRAFERVAGELPHDLVLVGAEGWRTESIHAALSESSSKDRVRLQGFAPPQELPLWYSACDMFVIPSLYEGFGLPLLEAMACGAPAISSNRASLPEVAGEAAMLVEPDVESLAAAIVNLARDDARRGRMAKMGPARAADFSWQRTAALTMESYRKALA